MDTTKKTILVTGGTGYIGSHVAIDLINAGYKVVIVDNLVNSKVTALDRIEKITNVRPDFHQIDLLNYPALSNIFEKYHFDLVFHFAGLKSVSESVERPLLYYTNNIVGTLNLLSCMGHNQVHKFIFSSSATVYGDQSVEKFTENLSVGQNIASPYGQTKYMIEQILKDFAASDPSFACISLRYFNPIGNHPSGLIGEDPTGTPNNLMPFIMKVHTGEIEKLHIYGCDYDTPDGTCRRDYIHVMDLSAGHLAAMTALEPGFHVYNLGTGAPTSVLEMVRSFEKISGKTLPYEIAPRRAGDLPEICADPTLANRELNWHATRTVDDAMRDTLAFLDKSAKPF